MEMETEWHRRRKKVETFDYLATKRSKNHYQPPNKQQLKNQTKATATRTTPKWSVRSMALSKRTVNTTYQANQNQPSALA